MDNMSIELVGIIGLATGIVGLIIKIVSITSFLTKLDLEHTYLKTKVTSMDQRYDNVIAMQEHPFNLMVDKRIEQSLEKALDNNATLKSILTILHKLETK